MQWLCPMCGKWIDAGWTQHNHMGKTKAVHGLGDMLALRAAEEAGISHGVDALASTTEVVKYWRTFEEPTRETPSGEAI